MADTIQGEILEDGTIKFTTSEISEENHLSADEFLDMIEDMAGGERITERKPKSFSMDLRSKDRKLETYRK